MAKNLQQQSQPSNADTISAQWPSRRAFLFTAASACGVVALAAWRPSFVAAAGGGAGTPSTVTIVQFSDAGKPTGKITVPRVVKSEAVWKQKLSSVSFDVTRREGTERPYSGVTWNNHDHGCYRCICCDNAVFSSETKFESGTGWPSF
jgi:peptide-methionine (R)-S-oxide reductase